MPIPSSINDLSTTAGANSPAGSESPGLIDDYLRTLASYIAQLRDASQNNAFNMAAASGTANAITATYSPAVTVLTDGTLLMLKAASSNTGAVTFSPNGLTASPVVNSAHAALTGGELIANGDVWLQWNSSVGTGSWVLIGDAALRQDLASPEGTGEVGHKRSAIASAVNYANQMLDTLAVNVREFSYLITDKPNINDPSTWDWSPAVQAAVNVGRKVVYGPGTFTQKSTINYTSANSFAGESLLTTVVKYLGPAGTWAFNHSFTGDGSDQWPGRVSFSDMTIQGDGTGNLGAGATVNGIRAADDTATLVNIPWYSLQRVKLDKIKTGIQLEGYGHLLTDCWAEKCLTGYDFTHPEQVQVIGCWANWCDVGLDINQRKLKSGHHMIIKGGSFQRGRIGIRAQNFYELDIDTYFELNTQSDIECGRSTDTNYTYSVKDLKVRCHSASGPALANLALYAVDGASIEYYGFGGVVSAIPHVLCNGYSKYIDVQYNPGGITSTAPWSFAGNSVLSCVARKIGGTQEAQYPTMGTGFTSPAGEPAHYRKLSRDRVSIGGSFSVTTGFSNPIFTLPLGYRPNTKRTFTVAWYDNSGAAWSTAVAVIEVRTNGDVWWLNGSGSNRTVYFGQMEFNINDGAF